MRSAMHPAASSKRLCSAWWAWGEVLWGSEGKNAEKCGVLTFICSQTWVVMKACVHSVAWVVMIRVLLLGLKDVTFRLLSGCWRMHEVSDSHSFSRMTAIIECTAHVRCKSETVIEAFCEAVDSHSGQPEAFSEMRALVVSCSVHVERGGKFFANDFWCSQVRASTRSKIALTLLSGASFKKSEKIKWEKKIPRMSISVLQVEQHMFLFHQSMSCNWLSYSCRPTLFHSEIKKFGFGCSDLATQKN